MNFIWSKLGWKGDYSHARPLCFANQWIVQDIPSLIREREKHYSLVWYLPKWFISQIYDSSFLNTSPYEK